MVYWLGFRTVCTETASHQDDDDDDDVDDDDDESKGGHVVYTTYV